MFRRACILMGTLALISLPLATATAANQNPAPGPMPYAQLAARWWQWALEIPAGVNPQVDTTGENCDVGQDGRIWFLAGVASGGSVERECTIPSGVPIFFPVTNYFYGSFLNDAGQLKPLPYQRTQTGCFAGTTGRASLDGVALLPVYEKSVPFVVHLPQENLFGLTEANARNLMVAPTTDEGLYVLLSPLSPGDHTLAFSAIANGQCTSDQQVTYHLHVG